MRYPRHGFEVVAAVSRILDAWIAIREPTEIPCAAPASRIIRDGASHFAQIKGRSGPDMNLRNDCKMLADGSYGGRTVYG